MKLRHRKPPSFLVQTRVAEHVKATLERLAEESGMTEAGWLRDLLGKVTAGAPPLEPDYSTRCAVCGHPCRWQPERPRDLCGACFFYNSQLDLFPTKH